MFNCKVCKEKDARIEDLKNEVAYLRELANPAKLNVSIPQIHAEADAINSGTADQPPSQDIELEEIKAEAIRLLSGTY